MSSRIGRIVLSCVMATALLNGGVAPAAPDAAARRVKVLFLGDNGHHEPAKRFEQLVAPFKDRGIDLTYSDKVEDLTAETLKAYDGLMIYANTTRISPDQEKAMVDFVRGGKGLIPLHCASACFGNSPKYIEMVGGQFQKHKTGVFNTRIVNPTHPVMSGFKPFETWDETYVHAKLNPDMELLQVRPESGQGGQGGDAEEPWTWTRAEGKGRVFYTAYGHDERAWGNPGFVSLVERGTRWATRTDAMAGFETPKLVGPAADVKPFEYVETTGVPFYDPTGRGPKSGGGAWNKMQKPLDPAESMKHFQVPEGFEVKLFVSEPQIVKPLTMAWDERGRLWVAESIDYPNRITEPGQGSDKITICEDTDGDGKADKFTTFAEHLNIPTSFTFYNGGIILHERRSTWFLKDTDGDGKADVKTELFTGWYKGLDTHAGPSNLRYGLDNQIWGMLGYAGFSGTVGGKTLSFSQGFYRFKPDGSSLEYLRSTNNNTWGIGFGEDGLVFGSTANGNPSNYLPIANRYYEAVRGWAPEVLRPIADSFKFKSMESAKVRQVDYHGGYTAAAGHALYTARGYPRAYWNRTAFVTEPTGHLIGTFVLEPRGADFKSHNPFNLLASDDEWSAPIMAEVGPDGCVWFIDWYNYIVQHNPTPTGYKNGPGNAYETPRRDKEHGRIYRIVYTGAKAYKPLDLSKATPAELVETLKNDNLFWRTHAQRLLVEKQDKSVIPELVKLVGDSTVDELGLNVGAIHALWTLKGLKALDGDTPAALAAVGALRHPSPGVRRNAVQVLAGSDASLAAILDANVLADADAQVRLAALLAIADAPKDGPQADRAGAAVLATLQKAENMTDRWIPDAAVSAAARHDAAFLNAVLVASAKTAARNPAPPQTVEVKPAVASAEPVNLIKNPSMEEVENGRPKFWRPATYGGKATHTFDEQTAHTGTHSVKITSDTGSDAGWTQEIAVKRNWRYRVSAWVKTKGINAGASKGVLFDLHELQQTALPKALKGDNDWTQIGCEFSTGGNERLQLNMLFGGWGLAKGEAWWDDVTLIELGPGTVTSLSSSPGGSAGKLADVIKLVTRHYAERAPVDSVVATLTSIKGAERDTATSVLDGLVAGWPSGAEAAPKLTDEQRGQIADLGKALSPDQRDRLLVLAKRWGQEQIFAGQMDDVIKTVKLTLAKESASVADRVDAAKRLIRLGDDSAAVAAILDQVKPQTGAELAKGLIAALADSRVDAAGGQILAKWADFTPAARKAAVAVMMRRVPWTLALLNGIGQKKLTRGDLAASDWQTLRLHKEKEISVLAKTLDANQSDPNRLKVLEKMLPMLAKPGDVAAGQKLFTARCAQCHTFNGQGGKVGPELSGIGARDPKEILAEIVDPNRSVEANYRMWTIETKDGDSLSGRLDTETQTSVELLDATGAKQVIQRKEIASMTASNLSIMPVGLIDDLKGNDVASLLEFLKTGHAPEKK